MKVHFSKYKDFNDLILWLGANYNKYEPSRNPGKETKIQYKVGVCILIVYSYNWCVQYHCSRSIHKGHRQALGMSFLKTTWFFSDQFCDEKMTHKWRRWFNNTLAQKNGAGKKIGITELLTVLEGIFRWFYMDTDILSSLYYDIHTRQLPAWKRAIDKFMCFCYFQMIHMLTRLWKQR